MLRTLHRPAEARRPGKAPKRGLGGRLALGAGAAGWPTSMWMTCPPAASIRAAAAITSITIKGGTSLRADGVSRVFTRSPSIASRIDICYLPDATDLRFPGRIPPQTGRIRWLVIAFSSGEIPVRVKKTRCKKNWSLFPI